jgi:uncharacterized protein YndB with AHSA1/START domain
MIEGQIAAAPWRVWRALTDFRSYPGWNPFVLAVEGRPEAGAELRLRLARGRATPATGRGGRRPAAAAVRADILFVRPGRELRLRLSLARVPRAFAHFELTVILEPIEDSAGGATRSGTRLRLAVHCPRGVLAPFLPWRRLVVTVRRGLETMTAALNGTGGLPTS